MPSEPFLHPILEDVELDLEAQQPNDNLLDLQTYRTFTKKEWYMCSKILVLLVAIVALLIFLIYIVFYSLEKY
jgi:hypothetical protein